MDNESLSKRGLFLRGRIFSEHGKTDIEGLMFQNKHHFDVNDLTYVKN